MNKFAEILQDRKLQTYKDLVTIGLSHDVIKEVLPMGTDIEKSWTLFCWYNKMKNDFYSTTWEEYDDNISNWLIQIDKFFLDHKHCPFTKKTVEGL